MTSYCTYANIVAQTGTKLAQATVEALIVMADRHINGKLKARGFAADYTAEELINAGISLTTAKVRTRQRMDGTTPNSLSLGTLSMSDNNDAAIKQLIDEANEQIEMYMDQKMLSGTAYEEAARNDSKADTFHLDQSSLVDMDDDGSDVI